MEEGWRNLLAKFVESFVYIKKKSYLCGLFFMGLALCLCVRCAEEAADMVQLRKERTLYDRLQRDTIALFLGHRRHRHECSGALFQGAGLHRDGL